MIVNKPFDKSTSPSDDHYILLFDQLPSLMWRAGTDAKCDWFNTKWLEFTGRKLEEEIGEGWTNGIHKDDLNECIKLYLENFNARTPFEMDFRLKHHSHEYRWIKDIGQPFFDTGGNFAGFLGTCYDIHDGKIAEENLRMSEQTLKKLNEELENKVNERTREMEKSQEILKSILIELSNKNEDLLKTNNDLDNFIYTASHDLKAPISNIEGLVMGLKELLPAQNSDENIHLYLGMINSSIERFKKTIVDLTEISKVQKPVEKDEAKINLNEIVKEVKETILNIAHTSNVSVECDLKEIQEVYFSRKNMRSIIYNLLSNAIKYRDVNRPCIVRIFTEKTTDKLILNVQDNGLGIPYNKKNDIFTMFKRFHNHVEGSGVGLYIVNRIVTNAAGTIDVESEVGEGTTIKIVLPLEKL